jgi:hypothetical protein
MADVPIPGHQTLWTNKLSVPKSEYQILVQQYPESDAQLMQLLQVLGDIENVARHIPASVGESAEWSATGTSNKVTVQTKTSTALNILPKKVVTRSFFTPSG